MESEPRFFSSRELTESVGCTRKALRVYQAKGLIAPARTTGNRRYSVDAFERLRFIVAMRGVGLSVEEVRTLLRARDEKADSAGEVAQRLADELGALIPKITEKMQNLHSVRNELIEARETLAACAPCTKSVDACGDCVEEGALDPTSSVLLAGRPTA